MSKPKKQPTKTTQQEPATTPKHKLDFKRMLWIFIICCVIGCLVETLFCVLVHGRLESRQGVIFGPLTPIYGVGALLMCFTAVPLAKKSWILTFIVGAISGGIVEFAGSYLEEAVLGAESWNFSHLPFPIAGGRTSLIFMVFWGALSCVFAKWIYPAMIRAYDNFKPLRNTALCAFVTVFLIFDFTISAVAVNRWRERLEGQPQSSSVDAWLDEYYYDDLMQAIYPNMRMIGKPSKSSE